MIRLLMLVAAMAVCTHCTESRPPVNTPNHRSADTVVYDSTHPSAGPAASSAQKAYVDPESGQLGPRPASQADPELKIMRQAAPETPAEELKEQPSPVPGGGMMIDLKGKFRNPASVAVDDDDDATAGGDP